MDLFACHKYLRQELLLYIFPNQLGNIPNSLWSTIKWWLIKLGRLIRLKKRGDPEVKQRWSSHHQEALQGFMNAIMFLKKRLKDLHLMSWILTSRKEEVGAGVSATLRLLTRKAKSHLNGCLMRWIQPFSVVTGKNCTCWLTSKQTISWRQYPTFSIISITFWQNTDACGMLKKVWLKKKSLQKASAA